MLGFHNTTKISRRIILQMHLLNKRITFQNSTLFPYKFGGLHSSQINRIFSSSYSDVNSQLLKELFDENILDNFAVAYRNIIKGLHQKDKEYLNNLFEKNLIKNIQFPETNLLNPEAEIEVKVGKIYPIVYGCFDRQKLSQKRIKRIKQTDDTFAGYVALNKNQDNAETQAKNKSLFCFHIYFKSALKLNPRQKVHDSTNQQNQTIQMDNIKYNQNQKNQEKEMHMIQFQIQSQIKSLDIFKKGFGIFFKNLFNIDQMVLQFIKLILGVNQSGFQWKIGDIDRVLQGNFTELTKQNKNQ